MDKPSAIPSAALSGMEGWEAVVVWSLLPEAVTWRLVALAGEVRYLKVSQLGRELTLSAERDRMNWAASRLPVPRVLGYGSDATHEWLLTDGLPGVNATDVTVRADPARLVSLLAEGLRRFHSVPLDSCPFDSRAETLMRIAQRRVAAGLADELDHEDLTAEAALAQLVQLRPKQEDLVVCHGDYCLPNVLISDGQVSGYVDLGKLGIADRWWDLAVATWSVTRNLGPGWEALFLDAYGVRQDGDKAAFYRLLYDLGP